MHVINWDMHGSIFNNLDFYHRSIYIFMFHNCFIARQAGALESLLTKVDGEHDACNRVMATGEINGFPPELQS